MFHNKDIFFTCTLVLAISSIAFSASDDIQFARIVCKDSSQFEVMDFTFDYPIAGTPSMVQAIKKAEFSKGKQFYENECHPKKYMTAKDFEDGEPYLQEERTSTTVLEQTSKFVLYNHFFFEYSGGAHGNGGATYTIYIKPHGNVFEINETDYKNPRKVRDILWKSLISDIEPQFINELQSYGTTKDSLRISKNIYYEKDSLSFEYYTYEIAPYAWGQVQVKVPYEAILPYLKPEKAKVLKEIQDSFK